MWVGLFPACSLAQTLTLHNDFIRIMPIGDSNTEGPLVYIDGLNPGNGTAGGSYRARLYDRIISEIGEIPDFVGYRSSSFSDGDVIIDHDHEGYGGYRIDQIADIPPFALFVNPFPFELTIEDRLKAYKPAVVLLMIGTNDISQDFNLFPQNGEPGIVGRYEELIERIFSTLPNVHILVASVPPRNPGIQYEQTIQFNTQLEDLVNSQLALGRNIGFVDAFTPLLPWVSGDFSGVHPDKNGYDKIADAFFEALAPIWNDLENPGLHSNNNLDCKELVTNEFNFPPEFAVQDGYLNQLSSPFLGEVTVSGFSFNPFINAEEFLIDGLPTAFSEENDTWDITFEFDLNQGNLSESGFRIDSIVAFEFGNFADDMRFDIEFAFVNDPSIFSEFGSFNTQAVIDIQTGTKLIIQSNEGLLADSVAAVKFKFLPGPDITATYRYSEMAIYGIPNFAICDVPSELQSNALNQSTVELSWSDQSNAGVLIRGRESGTNIVQATTIPEGQNTFVVTGLEPGTSYEWQIKSLCLQGESEFSEIQEFTTLSTANNEGVLQFDLRRNQICFSSAESFDSATLTLFDLMGRTIELKHLSRKAPCISIPYQLKRGLYIYQLRIDKEEKVGKVFISD